jgi:hypothetical protein
LAETKQLGGDLSVRAVGADQVEYLLLTPGQAGQTKVAGSTERRAKPATKDRYAAPVI